MGDGEELGSSGGKGGEPAAKAPSDEPTEPPTPVRETAGGGAAPFDAASAVPMRHVDSMGNHADDVSSLQHTERGDVDDRMEGGAVDNGSRGDSDDPNMVYYEHNDVERDKNLRRRNVLIIVMLVLFLGLVVAIGVGVGLAVQQNPPANEDAEGETMDSMADVEEITSVPSSFPSSAGPCIPLEIGIIFDEYPSETGWFLVRGEYDPEADYGSNDDIVWRSKYYKQLEYSKMVDRFTDCFPKGRYSFVFTDKSSDGICCNHGEGAYTLSSEGKVIATGGAMAAPEESHAFELPFVEPDPVDDDGDGRDDRLGLLMPYDSAGLTEGIDCEEFRLVVITDQFGVETTWELFEGTDKSGTMVANGGPYGSEFTYVVDYCLESPRQYVLYVYDWDGRGLCCEYGEGWFRATSGEIVLVDHKEGMFSANATQFVLPADGSVVFGDT